MDALAGNIDLVEVFQFGVLKIDPWYEMLSAGLRVTGVAGSDFLVYLNSKRPWPEWIPLLGPERAMVKARPGVDSFEQWARAAGDGTRKRLILTAPVQGGWAAARVKAQP